LFDTTVGLASAIISVDLVLSVLYFVLYTQIDVIGIMKREDDKKKNDRFKMSKI